MEGREVGRGREGRKKKVYMNIKAPVYNVQSSYYCQGREEGGTE